jgi:hypothetical protein
MKNIFYIMLIVGCILSSGCAIHTTRSYSTNNGNGQTYVTPSGYPPVEYGHYRVIPRYPDYPPYRRDSLALYRIDR